MTTHTPGPVETLARLALQSDRYVKDEDFGNAVDAVVGFPVFDAAPELLEALVSIQELVRARNYFAVEAAFESYASAAIAKATGGKP